MKKEEHITRYGKAVYVKQLAWSAAWRKAHPREKSALDAAWNKAHPEEKAAQNRELSNKGGKRYDKMLEYNRTGLRGERNKVRSKHGNKWRPYKNIIAPWSQIHHEWIPGTAKYRGVALVEADQHMHGIVDVIEILEGKIRLLTEEEVRARGVIT
jgi:hypothetical protein